MVWLYPKMVGYFPAWNLDCIRNQTDRILLKLGWVFDINFDETLQEIVDRGHYAAMKSILPDTGAIPKALRIVDQHVSHKLNGYRRTPAYSTLNAAS